MMGNNPGLVPSLDATAPLALRFLSMGGAAARAGTRVSPDARHRDLPAPAAYPRAAPAVTSTVGEEFFLENLPLIDSVARSVCRTHGMSEADTEDFGADVRLKLIENDYEVLRQFERRSKLRTYLTVIVLRLYFDHRNREKGKWHASAAAQRMGPTAVLLETFIVRDHLPFDEACQRIISSERGVTRRDLEEIAIRLPPRVRRMLIGDEALIAVPAANGEVDDVPLVDRERAARKLAAVLGAAVRTLTPRDRLVLRMKFQDGLTIADIAEALHCDARPLYRQVTRVLRHLRTALEAAGFDAADAERIISRQELDISLALITEPAQGVDAEGPAATGG